VKRDMDLIRRILLDVEQCDETNGSGHLELDYEECSDQKMAYHVKMLREAGLIEALDFYDSNSPACWPTQLTWAGHEFLDAARDDTRWQKAKRFVIDKAGSVPFEVLKQILVKLATESVG
jgi:hypothetical protein